MKKFLLLFLCGISLQLLSHQSQTESHNNKTERAALHAVCTINIIKAKLAYANSPSLEQLQVEDVIATLTKLYSKCNSIINIPEDNLEQPALTEHDWISKSLREITALHQNYATRNCFNNALSRLQQLGVTASQNEKELVIQSFFNDLNNCSYQHAQKISKPHLEGAIQRWQNNPETLQCDIDIFKVCIKHTPQEKRDFNNDLLHVYKNCNLESVIPFEDFSEKMHNKINKLKHDLNGRACLEDLIHFQFAFFNVRKDEEKEALKNNFCVRYLQCKNK